MKLVTKMVLDTNWETVKRAVEDQSMNSGDKLLVALKNGENISLVMAHDQTGKPFFVFENCINETRPMNTFNTNKGGWKATDIRKWLNTVLYELLPDELQTEIVPTKIVQVLNGKRIEVEDKLFLLSKTQLFGKGYWSDIEPEDSQLDIYTTEKSRVKECADNGTWFYGLRTPNNGNSSTFCYVTGSGNASNGYAGNYRGVAPGFCIT